MKFLATVLFLFSLAISAKAQLKIDTNYLFMVNDTAYGNGSYIGTVFGPDNVGIKEVASGKSCAIVSVEWTFVIGGQVFHVTKASDIKSLLNMTKPKDKLFMEKIKLASGCFIPPNQIAFGVQ